MKRGILLLAIIFVVFFGNAQDVKKANAPEIKKGYIVFEIGPSIPLGDFGSNNIQNEKVGDALTGLHLNLSFAYLIGKILGIAGTLFSQSNPIDEQPLLTYFNNQAPYPWTWGVISTSWFITGFMTGPYVSFPVEESKKTTFELKGLLGFANSSSPEVKVSGTYNGLFAGTATTKSKSASTFVLLIGGGFCFRTGRSICLLLNLDYLVAEPEFLNVVTYDPSGQAHSDSYSQDINSLNFTFGIGLTFR